MCLQLYNFSPSLSSTFVGFLIQGYDLERPLDRPCWTDRLTQAGIVAGFRRGDDGFAAFHSQCSGGTHTNTQTTPIAAGRINQRYGLFCQLPVSLDHVATLQRKTLGFLRQVYHLSDALSLTFVELGYELLVEHGFGLQSFPVNDADLVPLHLDQPLRDQSLQRPVEHL